MVTPRPAVKALIEQDDEYLLLKQTTDNGPLWTLPGGKVKFGETPHEALRREVREEVTLDVDVGPPVGVYDFQFKDTHIVVTVFDCKCEPAQKADITGNPADEGILSAEWVPRNRSTDRQLNDGLRILLESVK